MRMFGIGNERKPKTIKPFIFGLPQNTESSISRPCCRTAYNPSISRKNSRIK